MGKKASVKPAQQVLNANLFNKNGAAASSNASGSINISSIKCHVCARHRGLDCYSNRQILKHKNSIHNPYIPGGRSHKDHATCKDCTAVQADTLHCFVCDQDKPLKRFLKVQRSIAKPRCKACVQFCLDTERTGEIPDIDDYQDDSSDESDVDDDSDGDVDGADDDDDDDDDDEESDVDVDAPPTAKKAAPSTSNVARQLASMSIQNTSSGSSGTSTPVGRSTSIPSSRGTPSLDNDVNGSDDGVWETVRIAGKSNSAFRTPSYASRAASGIASPSGTFSSYTTTRTSTSISSPPTGATSVSRTSTGREKWGKPAKLKPEDVVEDVWKSDLARKNNWNAWGGQPKLVQPKKGRRIKDDDSTGDIWDDED